MQRHQQHYNQRQPRGWAALVKLDSEGAPFQIGAVVVGDGLLGVLLAAETDRAVALCKKPGIQCLPFAHAQSPEGNIAALSNYALSMACMPNCMHRYNRRSCA
jgi:hypothetical protein